jgi:hypothetical protein
MPVVDLPVEDLPVDDFAGRPRVVVAAPGLAELFPDRDWF